MTHGLSPASLVGAYMDWLTHLAMSPGKQQELAEKAVRKIRAHRPGMPCQAAFDQCKPCIEPLPQDRRFAAPEWQQWPFNLIYQSFLLHQQWWHNATSGVPGVTAHHEHVVTFATRQVLDMVSPSNFLLTNPEVLGRHAQERRHEPGAGRAKPVSGSHCGWPPAGPCPAPRISGPAKKWPSRPARWCFATT